MFYEIGIPKYSEVANGGVKGVLINFAKVTRKHLWQSLLFIATVSQYFAKFTLLNSSFFYKVSTCKHATLLKKRLRHRYFPITFVKF